MAFYNLLLAFICEAWSIGQWLLHMGWLYWCSKKYEECWHKFLLENVFKLKAPHQSLVEVNQAIESLVC